MTEAPHAMSAERFSALAAAYGAALEAWPAPERASGRAFALTPQGQQILRQAVRLDSVLSGIAGHWCIRVDVDRSGSTASTVGQPPTPNLGGSTHHLAPRSRRSRSDKLEALLSGSSSHAR